MQTSNHPTLNPRRLVLCFDGTGNKFQGDVSDTNIVKLFQMFDRRDPDQFHYYQREWAIRGFSKSFRAFEVVD